MRAGRWAFRNRTGLLLAFRNAWVAPTRHCQRLSRWHLMPVTITEDIQRAVENLLVSSCSGWVAQLIGAGTGTSLPFTRRRSAWSEGRANRHA